MNETECANRIEWLVKMDVVEKFFEFDEDLPEEDPFVCDDMTWEEQCLPAEKSTAIPVTNPSYFIPDKEWQDKHQPAEIVSYHDGHLVIGKEQGTLTCSKLEPTEEFWKQGKTHELVSMEEAQKAIGKAISRSEALQISHSVLKNAEKERGEAPHPKIKVGDRVLIARKASYWNPEGEMDKYLGAIQVISEAIGEYDCYRIKADPQWVFGAKDFDLLPQEPKKPKFKPGDKVRVTERIRYWIEKLNWWPPMEQEIGNTLTLKVKSAIKEHEKETGQTCWAMEEVGCSWPEDCLELVE